jgi:hypothetical protein
MIAITASVRFFTFNAFKVAATWFFTVGSANLRMRTDFLVTLTLHHQREHFNLSFRYSKIDGR